MSPGARVISAIILGVAITLIVGVASYASRTGNYVGRLEAELTMYRQGMVTCGNQSTHEKDESRLQDEPKKK